MTTATPNLLLVLPELVLLGMACCILLVDVCLSEQRKFITYGLVQLSLVAVLVILFLHYNTATTFTFSKMFVIDKLGNLMKISMVFVVLFIFLFSRNYLKENKIPRGEFYVLGMLSLLGMMVLVSTNDFITLYLGLELLTLPMIAMVALQRESAQASEAAIKFFVMSALASGILLYGLSLLYGMTATLNIVQMSQIIPSLSNAQYPVLLLSLVFVVIGICFKIGAVPFHMWLPDVYAGAPNPITLFVSSAPKIAGLAMGIRLLVSGMPGLHIEWQALLIVIAALSIGLGNLVAVAQSNFKRMLAYSSIAHMGYMLLGLLAATQMGYSAAVFYALVYAVMALGAFAILVILSRNGIEVENIRDLRGLNSRSPWLAFLMLLILFSMAGIPPLAGFFTKVGVIEALIGVHLIWLAVYAILFAVIGCYYYIRVVKEMYFEEPETDVAITYPLDARIAISINGLFVLVLGIFPGWLFALCRAAFGA